MGLDQRLRRIEQATVETDTTGFYFRITETDGRVTWWPKEPPAPPQRRIFVGSCARATFEAT